MLGRPFNSFGELVLHMEKGRDYDLTVRNLGAPMTVTAIHGGAIEPLTDDLAQAIAEQQHNLYILRGLLPSGNDMLRIPSLRFAEMHIDGLLQRSRTALSIDGVKSQDPVVKLGGANSMLSSHLCNHLEQAGFQVGATAFPEAACAAAHFYNRPQLKGVQIELSKALRQTMVEGPLEACIQDTPTHTEVFQRFVSAVRAAIKDYQREAGADLGLTMERFEEATANFPPSLRDIHHHH